MTGQPLPGPVSTGGRTEHLAGLLLDAAHDAYAAAATPTHPVQAAVDRGRGRAYLHAVELASGHDGDLLYVLRHGHLPEETTVE